MRFGYDVIRLRTPLTDYQQRLLRDLDVDFLVDVGANEGQYVQRMRALGYARRVLSFEPSERAYERLRRAARPDPSWDIDSRAVGAEDGVAWLNVSGNSVSSSLLPMGSRHLAAEPRSAYVTSERVAMTSLDAVVPVDAHRIWLKIDTQGSELEVIAGARLTLPRVVAMQMELSLVELYNGQPLLLECLALMAGHGFQLASIEPGLQDPATGDLLQLDGIFMRPECRRSEPA